MIEQPGKNQRVIHDHSDGPSVLLWLAVGIFLILVLSGIAGWFAYQSSQRLSALLPLGAGVTVLIIVGTIAVGIIFRRQLPPRFLMWIFVVLLVLAVVGAVGGLVIFRNVLPPRYQEEMVTLVPFMNAFLPPTPEGGIVPTVALDENTNISPADLLKMPLGTPTGEPGAVTELTATLETATVKPTSVSVLPTSTPLPPTPTSVPPTPTLTPTPETQPAGSAAVPTAAVPSSARLYGFKYAKQTWNNCGPANITMALSYYGWTQDQSVAESYIRPEKEDKNVSPGELVAFVNEQSGVRALTRIGGDLNLLRALLANNLPVVIETAYTPEGYDWIGHYRTLVGYDDVQQVFYIYDSFLGNGENGEGVTESYAQLNKNWKAFNRTLIVLYEREREGLVRQLLGDRADLTLAAENALAVAQEEARANPQDGFAWFNIGSALTQLGRYEEAAVAYDQARRIGIPWRMIWYQFGPFEAYYQVGRYNDVLSLVEANLTNGANVEETYFWQGKVYAAQGKTQDAISSFRLALRQNPRFVDAQSALDTLT